MVRARYNNPECLQLFEKLVFFIAGKAGCISHAVPTYQPMLKHGLQGLIDIAAQKEKEFANDTSSEGRQKKGFYAATQIALKGMIEHANNLADEAEEQAAVEQDPDWKNELSQMAAI